ncbi:MAG: hypothetical protein HYW47_04120 [Deltaproteobacteria bacterium]|nr:hypothetical protein [Deltaproteobacteria bacterium]
MLLKLLSKKYVLIFTFFSLIWSGWLLASSCHGGGGGETLVLPSGQRYQFGFSTSYRFIQGSFDSYGGYTSQSKNSSISSTTTSWSGGVRLSESWQLSWALPLTYNKYVYSGKDHSRASFGDPVFETRYTFLEDVRFLWYQPELSFYGGIRLPFGTSTYNSSDPYGADVVGEGLSFVHSGMSAAKLFRPFKLTVNWIFYYPLEKEVDQIRNRSVAPYDFKSGNRIVLNGVANYLISNHWATALGIKGFWILKSKKDQNVVEGSSARLFSMTASLGYAYDVSWGMALNYETPFPFYKYGVNQPNSHTLSLSVNYGIF